MWVQPTEDSRLKRAGFNCKRHSAKKIHHIDAMTHRSQHGLMRVIITYAVATIASMVILGYTVHMFIGGMVSQNVEYIAIAVVVGIDAMIIGWMTWDILHRRWKG